jgi:O-succinylbenzoate synthase
MLLIEQPLPEYDWVGHVEIAAACDTPICLDESILSLGHTEAALNFKAADIINIKPGRVGGLLESVDIHDLCVSRGIPVWCGGMLETGIGRAANVALAAMPGFILPGDTSASARYFAVDITEPFVLENGQLRVPTGPGIGVDPIPAYLEELTSEVAEIEFSN